MHNRTFKHPCNKRFTNVEVKFMHNDKILLIILIIFGAVNTNRSSLEILLCPYILIRSLIVIA